MKNGQFWVGGYLKSITAKDVKEKRKRASQRTQLMAHCVLVRELKLDVRVALLSLLHALRKEALKEI